MRFLGLVLCAGLLAGCVDRDEPSEPDAGSGDRSDETGEPEYQGPPFAELGESCMDDLQCHTDLCVQGWAPDNSPQEQVDFPGGMCTMRCEFRDPYRSCPEGNFCLLGTDRESHCFGLCETSDDCRVADGWRCQGLGFLCTVQVCLPPDIRGNEHCEKL